MQKQAQDYTDTGKIFLVMMYNVGYMSLLEEFGRPPVEATATLKLASLRSYQMPPDLNRPVEMEFVNGDKRWPLTEVADPKRWALIKSGNRTGEPRFFHYRPRFGIGGGIVELDPVPTGDGNTDTYLLEMIYEASDRELSKLKYVAGKVQLTNDSVVVTGSSTTFTSDMVGRYLRPTGDGQDRMPYRITSYVSAGEIHLEQVYGGAGSLAANLDYEIIEMPNLPSAMHILPCFFSLEQWWSTKGNAIETAKFGGWYRAGLKRARKVHSDSIRDGIIGAQVGMGDLGLPQYPTNFPAFLTD